MLKKTVRTVNPIIDVKIPLLVFFVSFCYQCLERFNFLNFWTFYFFLLFLLSILFLILFQLNALRPWLYWPLKVSFLCFYQTKDSQERKKNGSPKSTTWADDCYFYTLAQTNKQQQGIEKEKKKKYDRIQSVDVYAKLKWMRNSSEPYHGYCKNVFHLFTISATRSVCQRNDRHWLYDVELWCLLWFVCFLHCARYVCSCVCASVPPEKREMIAAEKKKKQIHAFDVCWMLHTLSSAQDQEIGWVKATFRWERVSECSFYGIK